MKDVDTLVREHLRREAQAVRFDAARWNDRVTERRRRPRLPGVRALGVAAAALLLVAGVAVPLFLVSGLGGGPAVVPGGRSIGDYGLRIDLPQDWDGRVRGPLGTVFGPHLHAANFPLPQADDDVASRARAGMTDEQVTIVVIDVTTALARDVRGPQEPYEPIELPVRLRPEDFTDRVEAVDPDHSFARRSFSVADRSFQVWMEFGTDPAPERLVGEANAVLASLSIEPVGETSSYQRHVDLDDALAITIPSAWTFHQDPTQPIEPKNVFAVGSWDFPRGGVCAPFDALDDLPPDGVFLWLIEYHGTPDRSDDFVPRPQRFDLADFRYGETACYAPDPQYQLRFQEAGRFFQWQVVLGPAASDSLELEVLRALDSLEVMAPVPEGCPADTGPWADPDCPWSAWTREVVERAGQQVTGDTGSALRAEVDGIEFFIWTTDTGPPPADEGYEPSFRVDETTIYTDGVRIAWQAQGFTIWVEVDVGGPVPREAIEDLVRASLDVDYDTIDTR
jgi:hypothetical protein